MAQCDPIECKSKCCMTNGRCGTEDECNPTQYLAVKKSAFCVKAAIVLLLLLMTFILVMTGRRLFS